METRSYTHLTHTNPYEELYNTHINIQSELSKLKLEVSNKSNHIKKLEYDTKNATKYIQHMEKKYLDSADKGLIIKTENISLKEKLQLYENKFGILS